MFAVPGWSVSSNILKVQTLDKPKPEKNRAAPIDNGEEPASKPNKKRNRSGKSKASDVNSANLADLWETVIEGKPKPKKEKSKKRQKISNGEDSIEDGAEDDVIAGGQEASEGLATAAGPEKNAQSVVSKPEKKKKKSKKERAENVSNENPTSDLPAKAAAAPIPKPAAQLTPLQASMRQKLISARFRHLNQTLYTTPSAHSLSLFQENPEMFTEYHEGFRRQVEVWPENPVDVYIAQIQARGKIRGPQRKGSEKDPQSEIPLPRTEGTCSIADLGCGDAALSTTLQLHTKKLHLKIHSFDLQSPSPLVTRADIANLPLPDSSIDVAIFCLALMGTNWIDFIEEAFRVLRWKGELWVAEIKSRFERVGKSKVVSHSVGNRKRPVEKKVQKRQEEEADDAVAAVEVDGHEDRNGETDVSAFVEVLRKRGFVLKGEGQGGESSAIDLSNKMFVRMHFVKGATPIKGKCVPVSKGMEIMGLETWKKKPKGKFIDEDAEEHVSSEASVLKPCVYKLR